MKVLLRIAMVLIGLIVIAFSFYINLTTQIKDFVTTAKSKEAVVSEYIEKCSGFIELMTIYGNDYLGHHPDEESIFYDMLSYDAGQESFNLDAVGSTRYETTTGNLTGLGSIPDSGEYYKELMLALEYNKYFTSFYKRLPEITWIYYTSDNDFINLYPWVSSDDFKYSRNIKTFDFYNMAIPENDPIRQPVWTPTYVDEAGKGMMITLSSPVYNDDVFMGVVSLDLTTAHIGVLIDSEYRGYLVDSAGLVAAASLNVSYDPAEAAFGHVAGLSESNTEKITQAEENIVHTVGANYVYGVSFRNTPWVLYFIAPIWMIIGSAALYTLPIFVVCMLLFITYVENEKHKRTQILLSHSLEEIKSYHDLLENAARYDFLTNTCNRRGLSEDFKKQMDLYGLDAPPVSCIIGDIDEFKKFNDTYGHTAGDKVLVEIAKLMKSAVGEHDIVCRWGGEEFVIALFDKTLKQAAQIAEKLRKAIESNVIQWTQATELHATMTFGVAQHLGKSSIQESINRADAALYLGKEQGRNRVVVSE